MVTILLALSVSNSWTLELAVRQSDVRRPSLKLPQDCLSDDGALLKVAASSWLQHNRSEQTIIPMHMVSTTQYFIANARNDPRKWYSRRQWCGQMPKSFSLNAFYMSSPITVHIHWRHCTLHFLINAPPTNWCRQCAILNSTTSLISKVLQHCIHIVYYFGISNFRYHSGIYCNARA